MKKLGVLICAILLCTQINVISLQPTRYLKAVAHPGCGNVLLTWSSVNDSEGYDIYRRDEGQSDYERIVQLNTDKLYYKDTKNIVSGKSIKYYISALDKDSNIISKSPEMMTVAACFDENECSTKLKFQVGNYMYWVGERMDGPMNAAPEQTNGRVFLVIKYITSNIGANLEWLASEKKATIKTKDKTIELWIGKNQAKINGSMVKIDASNEKVAPYLSNGRTMLPMRFVGDNLGASEIKWDADTKTATLAIPKGCPEPDCNTLVVDSFKNNIITGVNSAGFKIMFDRSMLGDKTIEIGDLVTVCGTFEFRDEGVFITARKQKKIENVSGNWVNGTVVSVDLQKLTVTVKLCDGKEKTYPFSQDSKIGILPKSFPASLFVVDGKVINWKYIEREKICQSDQILSVDLSLTEVNCEKMYVKGDVIGSKPVTQMTITMPSTQWCDLKAGACMKIEYFFDGLGDSVGSKYAETDCPCDFEIITASDEIRTTSGSTFKIEFKIKNTGKYDGKFEPYAEAENFPGKFSVSPKDDTIPPGKESYFKVEGEINDDFEGSADLKIKVKCRSVTNEKLITIVANAPIFQVGTASGVSEVPTDENVNLSFDVTNYGDGPITVTAMIDKTDFPGKLTIEPMTKEIPNKNSRSFTITGV
ncbi:MAG: copper amine oxidase N-terminal domain-containing protein, partial [Caldiserica bacterium]|nr:copper amine oxidase N-terminal domain-containing protein [Caldisericota bacterium]